MNETFKDCNPTICWKDLLSNDNTYMTAEVIKEKCKCGSKSICFEILRLLKDWHRPEATELLKK